MIWLHHQKSTLWMYMSFMHHAWQTDAVAIATRDMAGGAGRAVVYGR